MATMPGEAARDPQLVRQLLESGMDCMRINCAHDAPAQWQAMIENLRLAQKTVPRQCRILMDLSGPKIRTGPIEPGPAFLKWRPNRDYLGRLTTPARIWITSQESPQPPPPPSTASSPPLPATTVTIPVVPLPSSFLKLLKAGDRLGFKDARRKERTLAIVGLDPGGAWAESDETVYLEPGTELQLQRKGRSADRKTRKSTAVRVGPLPSTEQVITLKKGDLLLLTRSSKHGCPAKSSRGGTTRQPAFISCTAPGIFSDVKPGEAVWLDDGKIGGTIETASPDALKIRITHARAKGEKLRADKGINFPESLIHLPALTPADLENLPFIVHNADLVGYSFVQSSADVRALQARLKKLHAEHLGLVLKIETRRAFEQLPHLLLTAMRSPLTGVMIARGDLAVECGFERLAEVQEEILWICEAAHTPVIWATQVLETLARDGQPSRAEITDAAMGVRAECVMLNKGPQMVEAVHALGNILRRMQAHQNKKTPMLRSLALARGFAADPSP
jgi:pyruvate kinase